ncbi:CNNM domain-containing protein, partial [Staphylococcus auricularis]|uniref:CNNM domain-containing protein n=1 Tax=Staphylococcus auricularis TaxID=29379 RepID=UPI0012471DBF
MVRPYIPPRPFQSIPNLTLYFLFLIKTPYILIIIPIFIFLFPSLFFSPTQTPLTPPNNINIHTPPQQPNKKAHKLSNLLTKPTQFITTLFIPNNIPNIILPTLLTLMPLHLPFTLPLP